MAAPDPHASADQAPTVASTFPANGATDVDVSANLTVTFSEPVNVTGPVVRPDVQLSCRKPATYSGGPTTFTIDPVADFVDGDACSLTVIAANVADQDAVDPPDTMVMNFTVGFSAVDACVHTFTPIYDIQGSGATAAITGNVTTAGVVVGDFEGGAAVSGFYIQDAAGDGDPATSDGIFVYTGGGNANTVSAGEFVRVTGFARERFGQTTINGADDNNAAVPAGGIVHCGTGSVAPTEVTMPFASTTFPERYEGMLVNFPQPLVISEYFNYARFGEIVLAQPLDGEDRPFTGTSVDEPGAAANARTAANAVRRITLDDNVSAQNPAVLRHPNGQPFSLTNRFRGGDTVANTTGILGFDFSLYRVYPTAPADYTAADPRPAAPENVGGTLRAAAMNTLNFFLTPDAIQDDSGADNPADNVCGGNANLECRGWDGDQPAEFDRQRDKLLQALAGLDADVIGLNELENTPGVEPLLDPTRGVVAGLNAMPGVGPYDAIDTGVIGTDAIRVGIIYRQRRRQAGRRLQDPRLDRRPPVHRHEEPALGRPDLRRHRDRRPVHGRRQPPEVEGLRLQRRRRPRCRRRPGELRRDPRAGGQGARRLDRDRPDRQRRPRLPDPRRPQLVRDGGLRRRDQGRFRRHGRHRRRLHEPHRASTRARSPTPTCSTASPATSTTPSPARR